jgi:hypothetical protein
MTLYFCEDKMKKEMNIEFGLYFERSNDTIAAKLMYKFECPYTKCSVEHLIMSTDSSDLTLNQMKEIMEICENKNNAILHKKKYKELCEFILKNNIEKIEVEQKIRDGVKYEYFGRDLTVKNKWNQTSIINADNLYGLTDYLKTGNDEQKILQYDEGKL